MSPSPAQPKILVCTVHGRCLSVLRASVAAYAKGHELVVAGPTGSLPNPASTFGEAYNGAMAHVFAQEDAVILANDDVVLTPTTLALLMEDVEALRARHPKLGLVGARSDCALPKQNIRFPAGRSDFISRLRWQSEAEVKETEVIAPILAWMSKDAFETAQFPPLNWYSDNVLCRDLVEAGFRHFVSRAYVHHVGSQSIGASNALIDAAARPWIEQHRPHYANEWFRPPGPVRQG